MYCQTSHRIGKDVIPWHISKLYSSPVFWPDLCKLAGSSSAAKVKAVTIITEQRT